MTTQVTEDEHAQSGRCSKCHEWRLDPTVCSCKRYEVALQDKRPDHDVDWIFVWADDAQSAIEKRAARYDAESSEYTIAKGNGRDFTAWCRFGDGKVSKWAVSGEAVPTYSAYGVLV